MLPQDSVGLIQGSRVHEIELVSNAARHRTRGSVNGSRRAIGRGRISLARINMQLLDFFTDGLTLTSLGELRRMIAIYIERHPTNKKHRYIICHRCHRLSKIREGLYWLCNWCYDSGGDNSSPFDGEYFSGKDIESIRARINGNGSGGFSREGEVQTKRGER